MKNLKNNTESILIDLEDDYYNRYKYNGMNLSFLKTSDSEIISGRVIIPSIFYKIKERIKNLNQRHNTLFHIEISSINRYGSDLYIPLKDKINLFATQEKKKLSIQILRSDPPMVKVCDYKDSVLLWTPFFCYGWTDASNIKRKDKSVSKYFVLKKNQQILISNKEHKRFIDYLKKQFLLSETPYLLGSSSLEQVDCSGLIMRSVYEHFRICLPKHSEDQYSLTGFKPDPEDPLEDLDLIYARSKKNKNKHIGFILKENGRLMVLEASYWKNKVIMNSLESFKKRFDIVGISRIFFVRD